MKVLIGIAQIAFLVLLISCKKNEMACLDCGDPKIKSAFNNKYFMAGYNSKSEMQLFLFDTITNQRSTGSGFCAFSNLEEWNALDILTASGNVLWACNRVDSFLLVKSFKTVNTCPAPIPDINLPFGLLDHHWYIDSLILSGSVYLPPCGYLPEILFDTNGRYFISLVVNDTYANYSFIGIDSINLEHGPFSLLVPKTGYQRNFEETFYTIIGGLPTFPEPIFLHYELNKNHLVLTGKKGRLILHCKT